ncbi:glycoside hydrolase [Dyella sp. A6]|uniref:glycoside hydrolase n=1 Tax=Dyella aluminiiresistens TaxID=3069105 RepID=UPI002E762AC0|nr:glycoside hydrolase [Dyella sp. A6]
MRVRCLLALALAASVPALAAGPSVSVPLRPDIAHPTTRFEGWGTALAWFANVTGRWPLAQKQHLADLLYGPDGLGFTIARYNIGGGNPAGTAPFSQPGADVPGFWHLPSGDSAHAWNPDNPAMWNRSADPGQRWWLEAVRRRVATPIFEAFSNSPPWFMTVSGRTSGAAKATQNNLRPGMEDAFASYLARVVAQLQLREHIRFRTLSPFNEPDTDYWYLGNRQEGSHWSPALQANMIDATAAALKRQGLATVVSAPDETNSHLFLKDWAAYPPATRRRVGQINVHSYGTVHQTGVRDAARAAGIRLWMSENDTPLRGDPENFQGMASPLAFAEHVVLDLKRLQPAAWVFWQAVENISARHGRGGSNWGLIKTDLLAPADTVHVLHITRKYWAMAQFSRYIRPGYRLIPVQDMDTAGALSPDGRTLVLVHVNGGITPRRLGIPSGWHGIAILTDAHHALACGNRMYAPPRSIVTLVLRRGSHAPHCGTHP